MAQASRPTPAGADFAQLPIEFHLCRHLLEQPSSHGAEGAACEREVALWANLHLLFWLSLVPWLCYSAWMGEHYFAAAPTAIYGLIMLLAAIGIFDPAAHDHSQGRDSLLAAAVGRDIKGKLSMALYLTAIASAAIAPWIAWSLYVAVALMWLVPDRRIERALAERTRRPQ